jgi:putative transposase
MPRHARLDAAGVLQHVMIRGIEMPPMYGITKNDILSKGRHPPRVEARSLFCYPASRDLGMSVTDLARLTGMTPSAITRAVERSGHIATEGHFTLGY